MTPGKVLATGRGSRRPRRPRAYRELIVTTAGLGECISGAILYDETMGAHQCGIIPGIKVDTGAKDMAGHPGEKITEGSTPLPGAA